MRTKKEQTQEKSALPCTIFPQALLPYCFLPFLHISAHFYTFLHISTKPQNLPCPHLPQKLKQVLKLSKDKWEAAARHAASAVQSDHRLRAWYVDDMQAGVLFASTNGAVDLQRAAGVSAVLYLLRCC